MRKKNLISLSWCSVVSLPIKSLHHWSFPLQASSFTTPKQASFSPVSWLHRDSNGKHIHFCKLEQFTTITILERLSSPSRWNCTLQRLPVWSRLNCRGKLAYNCYFRNEKEPPQEKFASSYKHGFCWYHVRGCFCAHVYIPSCWAFLLSMAF